MDVFGKPVLEGVAYMRIPRCDTCRYWRRDKKNFDPTKYSICDREAHDQKTAKMHVENRDVIFTDPDFGCVDWEQA